MSQFIDSPVKRSVRALPGHGTCKNASSQILSIHACSVQLTGNMVIVPCPGMEQRARPGCMSCPLVCYKREGQGSGPGSWPTVCDWDLARTFDKILAGTLSLGTFSDLSK